MIFSSIPQNSLYPQRHQVIGIVEQDALAAFPTGAEQATTSLVLDEDRAGVITLKRVAGATVAFHLVRPLAADFAPQVARWRSDDGEVGGHGLPARPLPTEVYPDPLTPLLVGTRTLRAKYSHKNTEIGLGHELWLTTMQLPCLSGTGGISAPHTL